MNKGGFSWKRATGISAAKSRVSRKIGIPLTKSGRQRKLGAAMGGCLLPILLTLLFVIALSVTVFAKEIPYQFISVEDYIQNKDNIIMVDVRSINSRNRSQLELPNEIWINPYKEKPLSDFINNQDKDKQYVVFCSCIDDGYSIKTAQILTEEGFVNVQVLKNGWDALQAANVETIKIKEND